MQHFWNLIPALTREYKTVLRGKSIGWALTRYSYKEGACFSIFCNIGGGVCHCGVSDCKVISRIVSGYQCLNTSVICCCRWRPVYHSCSNSAVCGDSLITWASTDDWILIICEKYYMRYRKCCICKNWF